MKRILIGIFAHPDDEAFGPSGTLLRMKQAGYEMHLIVLTDGENGTNPGLPNLGLVRRNEWRKAGRMLGATSMARLNLGDGKLKSLNHERIDALIKTEVERIIAMYTGPIEVSVMSFEPNGVTGHYDHIAASHAATRLFKYMRDGTFDGCLPKAIWYNCLSKEQAPLEDTPYYHPQARSDDYITHRVDVSSVLLKKYDIINCHASQTADGNNLKALGDELLSFECFHVVGEASTDLVS